ncbi:MAG: septum site-determining protein MinC [Burkholderiaceae bacterium]|jgi:septum site-determining protein MinC|nr:septum site-determining protein MinC [Burkholderiaceae bacterium]
MSVALAGRSPNTFDIKSASLPLLALRLKLPDLDMLAKEMAAQYDERPDFFDNDGVVLDLSALGHEHADAVIDFQRLGELLYARRLRLLAVRGGSQSQCAAAVDAGLLLAHDTHVQSAQRSPEPMAAPAELPVPGALVIDRPLRSGQQVYARGRDLVLLAVVNAGAEVVSDGHIHIYATLRGRAIAGARGWTEARIFAHDMKPELISIAGVYRTSEESLPPAIWGKPAGVHLLSSEAGDKLVFEPVAG